MGDPINVVHFTRDEMRRYFPFNLQYSRIEVHEVSFELCWIYALLSFPDIHLPTGMVDFFR
jgi:hypothetical protein